MDVVLFAAGVHVGLCDPGRDGVHAGAVAGGSFCGHVFLLLAGR